jgi:RHS repeat-associated protein
MVARGYNNRLQPINFLLGTSSNWNSFDCLFYNYYSSASLLPTQCGGQNPQQGSGDNGNVTGYAYFDNVNTSLSHVATYTYDGLNRLGTAVATGSSTYNLTFGYDRYGNSTCVQNQQTQGLCPTFSFNTKNQESSWTYGPMGNLTNDGVFTYGYDGEGRLGGVGTGATRSYTYNALGQIADDTGSSKLYDPFGNWMGLANDNNSGVFFEQEVVMGSRPVSIYLTRESDTVFLHPNVLGSSTQSTNQAGTSIGEALFYPWGQQWTTAGSIYENHFSTFYPGYDSTVGVSPAWARQYKNTQNRWLSPDPADLAAVDLTNPQSLNRYAYVGNNPLATKGGDDIAFHVVATANLPAHKA